MASPKLSERPLTAEEFFALPDPAGGGKMELVAGEVVTYMPVSGKHGTRASYIARKLGNYADEHSLGEVPVEAGFLLQRSPDTVLAPDVSFFVRSPLHPGGVPEEGFVPYPPNLAVEVVSAGDRDRDVTAKAEGYLRAGVQRVWLVRPKRKTVTVYTAESVVRTLGPGGTLTSEDAAFSVEGFALRIDDLFA